MASDCLDFDRVSVRRSFHPVLNDLSLSFTGGVLALVGPNGAGKSTLFSCIGEGRRIHSGRIMVFGSDLSTRSGRREIRATVGYQPQRPQFVSNHSVREAVEYAAWLKGIHYRSRPESVSRALALTNLEDLSSSRSGRLSGGQAKRLSIAQAIVHRPDLVVLDEPTAALDPEERSQMLRVIASLGDESNVILSTHLIDDLPDVCTDVVALKAGTVTHSSSFAAFAAVADGDLDSAYRRALGR